MDPDPAPAFFVTDLKYTNQKLFFYFFAYLQKKMKVKKKSQNSRIQGFSF